MAAISRIQVANFLTEGFAPGRDWAPLYRGETFRLFGQPTAMQIDNGGGKTSLTESCLYLLTRDRRLKPRVEDRIAPVDKGWTHVRIEFFEKSHDENVLQVDLITVDPVEMPGIPYVVGMCWSRTKEPSFYSYQGSLDDAPCYIQSASGLTLVANDVFRKSVERLPGARWNRWPNRPAWLDEIKQFTNIEILKQNVEFQLEGAGDYSAMINKVKPEGDESYDAAFFRQFIAPELLKHAMGAEGDPDEARFEDTILKTLKPAADALLDINRRQQELDDTREALRQFEPVLEKAGEVVGANADYEREMNTLARNAAVVHSLVGASPLPGVPVMPPGTLWASNKHVMAVLGHMVIDKKNGAVITDEGLATLTGVETGRINQYAREYHIETLASDLQPIELAHVLKGAHSNERPDGTPADDAQPIENNHVLKKGGRGGRRHAVICYGLDATLSLVSAISNLAGAKTTGLSDVLTRAFGIASDEIDTNLYRKRLRMLGFDLSREKSRHQKAKAERQRYQDEYEALLTQSREAEENQIAYEGFDARKREFPEAHWDSPIAARAWAQDEARRAEGERTDHVQRSSKLLDAYAEWQALTAKHGLTPLADAFADLGQRHANAVNADAKAQRDLDEAKVTLRRKTEELGSGRQRLDIASKRFEKLAGLAASMPTFSKIFGDADPMRLDPRAAEMSEVESKQKNDLLLQKAIDERQALLDLQPKTRLFGEIFGEITPESLTPSADLQKHLQEIRAQANLITEHQPLVNAVIRFREMYPGATPDDWFAQTAERRRALSQERDGNDRRVDDLTGELKDLSAFGAADDRVYAKALKLLGEHGIAFDRLHDFASRTVRGARLEHCLTAFSAFLSAPVIDSVETAGEAAKLLDEAKLTVPIFLKPDLAAFLAEGDIRLSDDVAYALWVGRRSRQVAILLNPFLAEDEKGQIEREIKLLAERNKTIEALLADISEESDAVKMTLDAREAIRRGSERIHAEATGSMEALQKKTPDLERRASPEAQEAISAMNRYVHAGADTRYCELAETIIPGLEVELDRVESRLHILAKQTTESALRALHAAKDFQQAGGDEALVAAKSEFERLTDLVNSLGAIVDELQAEVEGGLNEASAHAAAALRSLNETYAIEKRDLEGAIDFEEQGFVAFMVGAPARRLELDDALEAAQKRLQGIDFDRADRFIRSARSDARSMAERLAEVSGNRDRAEEEARKASEKIVNIEGEMGLLAPFMEAMHEMVVTIRAQHAKIAMFSEDIRRLAQASLAVDPEILGYAESIRIACMGSIPSGDSSVRAAMLNLGQCVNELEIDTAGLQRLSATKQRLTNEFIQRRDDFCTRSRTGVIKGLNQLEISIIAEAKTIEELSRIQTTRDSIQAQIDEISGNLDKIRETMEANKESSINSLASLARQAEMSLKIMDRVMKRTPSARFHVQAPVADEKEIEQIINNLLGQIEDRERVIRERGVALLNDEIERKAADYRQLIHDTIYRRIFSGRDDDKNPVGPKVYFTHASIRGTDMVPYSDRAGLSTGQKTALAMMWLIKQAEFAIARAATLYSSRKEQKAALQGAQRIMFFDGLFSNLSNEDYINDAFQGLRGVGENFQLIGLIHNPYYVNNKDIFPVHLVGRKKVATGGETKRRHVFVSIEHQKDDADDNGMILFTSAYKHHTRAEASESADV